MINDIISALWLLFGTMQAIIAFQDKVFRWSTALSLTLAFIGFFMSKWTGK